MNNISVNLSEKVVLRFSARGLPVLDMTSKSDPFVVVNLIDEAHGNNPVQIGISDVVMDNSNPNFTAEFVVDYKFEAVQKIKVDIFDKDSGPVHKLSNHTLIGSITFTIADLMCSPGSYLEEKIIGRRARAESKIIVVGETVANCRDVLSISFKGKKLANKDGFFGRSDPFITIYRETDSGSMVQVWQNLPIMNNLSPVWPVAKIPTATLCNNDYDRHLKIEIMDWDSNGSHDSMGSVHTSLNQIIQGNNNPNGFDVIEDKNIKKGKASGQLFYLNVQIEKHPSFIDYINGGLHVSLAVAIDYTASNGDPNKKGTLHSRSEDPNQYQKAISAIGSIVANYDTDNKFPVYGFGAQLLNESKVLEKNVSHCFSLKNHLSKDDHGEVDGVDGILEAYKNSFNFACLSGPTMFSGILHEIASNHVPVCVEENQNYLIVLIICDGIINDMNNTIEQIVDLSNKPVSIIIIGVGKANFDQMDRLDGDGSKLRTVRDGRVAERDIVQFVPYRDFERKGLAALADVTLKEIPGQVLSYMKSKKIKPIEAPPPYDFDSM